MMLRHGDEDNYYHGDGDELLDLTSEAAAQILNVTSMVVKPVEVPRSLSCGKRIRPAHEAPLLEIVDGQDLWHKTGKQGLFSITKTKISSSSSIRFDLITVYFLYTVPEVIKYSFF